MMKNVVQTSAFRHAVEREALVVGLDDRLEIRIEVEPAELEGLERPHEAADDERGDRDEHVLADETLFSSRDSS